MRTRVAVLAVVLCAALTACSDDGDEPDAKGSAAPTAETSDTTTVDCAKYDGTSQELAEAQAALYGQDAAARAAAIETVTERFEALKQDAPADVDAALDTLVSGFEQAAELMADPASADPAALQELAPELSEAGQKVTAYIVEQCG